MPISGRAVTVYFLVAAECEINIVLRLEALGKKILGGLHNAVERAFGIERSSAPKHVVLDDSGERILAPLALDDGHDVVMSHKHGRLFVRLALYLK